MFNSSLIKEIQEGHDLDEPKAIAMVVRRDAPSSGKPGDKAIISKSGEVKGWIGGGCTKGIIIKEALASMEEGTPRFVRIEPKSDMPEVSGVKNYKMTCASGGSVDVYIEPLLPMTKILIFGRSHIAKALCAIGEVAGFDLTVISDLADDDMFGNAKVQTLKEFQPGKEHSNSFVVVCTQGEDDASSVRAAIESQPRYLSFVASYKKANSVFMELKRSGVQHDELVKVKTPAGLDIKAKTAEEVAISILAQIIEEKRSGASGSGAETSNEIEDLYINPVCKIPVQKSTAKHVLDHEGEKVYFCCDGCKVSFEKEPEAYIART
ncbi:MAG: XdhC family protein [Bacteroidota bacterium]